tara:strand:+ start:169 stop:429 length:261 start_codon:yes stop_codon:yes gene_type:complete
MKNLIDTQTYSGLKGELVKLTGKDIVTKPTNKYNYLITWGYQITISNQFGNQEHLMYLNGRLNEVKKRFWEVYREESHIRIWKKQG